MFKRSLAALVQFVLFCALFLVGAYWGAVRFALEFRALQRNSAPPPMIPLWKLHVSASSDMIANGLVFAGALLVLILLIQALRRRLTSGTPWTLCAFVVAFAVSFLLHSPLIPVVAAN